MFYLVLIIYIKWQDLTGRKAGSISRAINGHPSCFPAILSSIVINISNMEAIQKELLSCQKKGD